MIWRILVLAIGYLIGNFQSAYLYGRLHGIDIREHGSGNAGSTNALRVFGTKAGLIVFAGDFLKMIAAVFLTRLLFLWLGEEYFFLLKIYTAFGVILGHDFPFYMNFKGGKGIAATVGLIAVLDWRLVIVCLILFFGIVALTKYVSLGSILVATAMWLGTILLGQLGLMDFGILPNWEAYLILGLIWALDLFQHRANIRRLLSGTENKLSFKKKPQEESVPDAQNT